MKKYIPILMLVAAALRLPAQIEVVSGGNVGIGTTSPGAKLAVDSTGSGEPALTVVGGVLGASTAVVLTNYPAVTTSGTNYTRNLGFYSWGLPIAPGVTDSGYRIGLDIENFVTDSSFLGTLERQYGLWTRVGSYSGGAGTILNSYGVYIENLDGPATVINKFGLYQSNSSARNYFAGNVGIGTTSPTYSLHSAGHIGVAGNMNFIARYSGSEAYKGTFGWSHLQLGNNGPNWIVAGRTAAGGALTFVVNNTTDYAYNSFDGIQAMHITSNGNVGIGTASPNQKLHVAGSVKATSFISDTTTYADFVFEPGYNLPELSEVEAHIKEHGHLPGIPSEAEAREYGIDLTAMQVKLLQKVEELTLHQIAQEKRLNEQSARIASLEAENTRLRTR